MRMVVKVIISIFLLTLLIIVLVWYFSTSKQSNNINQSSTKQTTASNQYSSNPLSIEFQRKKQYPGSEFKIEEPLASGTNYKQYIVSYLSDGLKIYGLLSIPNQEAPKGGFPAIIFNHGYIPPEEYRTTERYVEYFATFARNGYVVFKSDYRGNGNSEGKPEGAYYSAAYLTDVLNALSSIKKLRDPSTNSGRFVVGTNRIGMWGHSLGGFLTLRSMVTSKDIKAGVIWGGVVGTYSQLINDWRRKIPFTPSARQVESHVTSIRQNLVEKYGNPDSNASFWNEIDARHFLTDISGPLQLHQGLSDEEVPPLFSQTLYDDLVKINKPVEYYTYEGADHNLSQSFNLAMERSVEFFGKYLK